MSSKILELLCYNGDDKSVLPLHFINELYEKCMRRSHESLMVPVRHVIDIITFITVGGC